MTMNDKEKQTQQMMSEEYGSELGGCLLAATCVAIVLVLAFGAIYLFT